MAGLGSHSILTTGRLLILFSLLTPALARGETEIIPFQGYRLSGEFEEITSGARIDVDETSTYGLVINIDDQPDSAYEFLYSRQASRLRSAAGTPGNTLFDIDIEYFHLGGILLWPIDRHSRSFFGAGIGVTHFSPGLSGVASDSRVSLSITGGLKIHFNQHLGLRLSIRAYGTAVDSNTAIFCRDGACNLRFSGDLFTQFEGTAGVIFRF